MISKMMPKVYAEGGVKGDAKSSVKNGAKDDAKRILLVYSLEWPHMSSKTNCTQGDTAL